MKEPRIEPITHGAVLVEIPDEGFYSAAQAYGLGEDLMEAALKSQVLRRVDELMGRWRAKYVEGAHPEWQLLSDLWHELRLELGYDDSPRRPE